MQAVNTQLIETYWQVGRHIVEFEQAGNLRAEYGKALISQLAADLRLRHGKGFNHSNLIYMRLFYLRYPISAMQSHLLSLSHNETMVKRAESQMSQIKTQLVETRRFSQRAIDEKMGVSWN